LYPDKFLSLVNLVDISDWIDYSTFDAEGTFYVYEELVKRLKELSWKDDKSMWDFYQSEWLTFGELLTDIERAGMRLDIDYLKQIEVQGLKDYNDYKATFLRWATTYCPEAAFMNIESDAQKQQLLFAPTKNRRSRKALPEVRTFETPNLYGYVEPGNRIVC
jgi:DNA polymerase-1